MLHNPLLERLDDAAVRERIQAKEAYWRSVGVSSVPTVVFNNSSALNGARSVDVYKQVLEAILNKTIRRISTPSSSPESSANRHILVG